MGAYGKTQQGGSTSGEGEACVMRVVRVSGTIRKAEEEAIRRARMDIVKAKREGREGVLEEGKDAEELLEDMLGGGKGDEDLGVVMEEEEDDEDADDSDEEMQD